MKKLINHPKDVTREMLEGLVMLTPYQALLTHENVVIRSDLPPITEMREVAIISGGGSGHEPAHIGYVGAGMLHAAVSGDVFASPSADAILAAIHAVTGPMGALLIIKNYTGDRLNFGLAVELARAEGIKVEMILCGDDVSLREKNIVVGRRGIAGTVLVHKVAGACAATGASLEEVKREALAAATEVGTMGVALSPCTVPTSGQPSFNLGEQEIELGLGIHGEAGIKKTSIRSANSITDYLLAQIIEDRALKQGDRVVLLVNNLGSTPIMELGIMTNRAVHFLVDLGIIVERAWAGTFLSALDMAGCSISLLKLDAQRLKRIDALTKAPAWPNVHNPSRISEREYKVVPTKNNPENEVIEPIPSCLAYLRQAVIAATQALEDAEQNLTELDRMVGDGDLGQSLARGAIAARQIFITATIKNEADLLSKLGKAVRRGIGGTSGPLYSIFFLRAARVLTEVEGHPTALNWSQALCAGCDAIAELGGAKLGDRTMLDALYPASNSFADALQQGIPLKEAWHLAAKAADKGAQLTASMFPRLGRSSYLGERAIGIPDPGAVAVSLWIKALAELV